MHLSLNNTICSNCATLSVIVYETNHYQNTIVTSHSNTCSVPHDQQEVVMEAHYNDMWEGLF